MFLKKGREMKGERTQQACPGCCKELYEVKKDVSTTKCQTLFASSNSLLLYLSISGSLAQYSLRMMSEMKPDEEQTLSSVFGNITGGEIYWHSLK